MLQWVVPHLFVYGEHKLHLIGYKKKVGHETEKGRGDL